MKKLLRKKYYQLLSSAIIIFGISYALEHPLQELKHSLIKLSYLLSQPFVVATTYEELKVAIDAAYAQKKPELLDTYQQTVAITTAKYLLSELIKEGNQPENRPAYIPLMAYITQKVTEQYPDKNVSFNCVSLASGDLENEFLLIRALRHVGYATIKLVCIDTIYDDEKKEDLEQSFSRWCSQRKIPISLEEQTQAKNVVTLILFKNSYKYIEQVNLTKEKEQAYFKKLPKNNLFIMIQPSSIGPVLVSKDAALTEIIKLRLSSITPNYISFNQIKEPKSKISLYLPYNLSDSWIMNSNTQYNTIVNDIETVIAAWPNQQQDYQGNLLKKIVETFWDKLFRPKSCQLGQDTYLSFYDLIKHTSINPLQTLAFTVGYYQIEKEITRLSGSLQKLLTKP